MTSLVQTQAQARSVNFNDDWTFHLGDEATASESTFDSSRWRKLSVPHDWSVEQSFTQENAGGSTAFLPGGIGWYRKTFRISETSRDQITRIEFDGIYNNAEIWINGHYLGLHPYGYTPFSYNLTEHLNYGDEENVIAVKVDRSAYLDCRWYPGSGIYRDVKLVTIPKVHIPQWGVDITTPEVNEDSSTVLIQTTVSNQTNESCTVQLSTILKDNSGQTVGSETVNTTLEAGETRVLEKQIQVLKPTLWSPQTPTLYTAHSELHSDVGMDSESTTFSVRHIRYDANHGFFLNNRRTIFKGVCLHHEAGSVGAAVPLGVWKRRLEKLKELGCNAIRTAHNPPSEKFLDLCDQMGFLVQDEIFDEWDHPKDKRHNYKQLAASEETEGYTRFFREWAEADTNAMMLRDRNHPCIVMWSIGNEIEWTYPGYEDAAGYWDKSNDTDYYHHEPPYDDEKRRRIFKESDRGDYELAETAARLAAYVRKLDTTRPVTANMVIPTVSQFSGYSDVLDVDGYSYRQAVYQYCKKRAPDKPMIGTENWIQWSEWKPVLEHRYIAGIFLWPGISYMGEAKEWPQKANSCGLMDLAGFENPSYHYFKSLWSEEKMVRITTTKLADSHYLIDSESQLVENPDKPRPTYWDWPDLAEHWNYEDGELIYVEIYSNVEAVELSLNGISLGKKSIHDSEDRILRWVVPFEAGILTAIANDDTKTIAQHEMKTVGEPEAVALSTYEDRMKADGCDVAHITAQLVDADGQPVRHTNRTIHFGVKGNATNIGVDNGSSYSVQDCKSDKCTTDKGHCLMILQAGTQPESISIEATSDDLKGGRIIIEQI